MNMKSSAPVDIDNMLLKLAENKYLNWFPGVNMVKEYLQMPDDIPRSHLSVAALLKVGIDESLLTDLGSLITRPRLPTPGMRQRATRSKTRWLNSKSMAGSTTQSRTIAARQYRHSA